MWKKLFGYKKLKSEYCKENYDRKMSINQQSDGGTSKDDDFEMMIEDVFFIRNRGTVITGRIKSGTIRVQDTIVVKNKTYKVRGIEMMRKLLEFANAGDNIGLLIDEYEDSNNLKHGDIVIKKCVETAESSNSVQSTSPKEQEYLDDITFVQEMKHVSFEPWEQYDILLAARGYGWNMMIEWADYIATADLESISEVITGEMSGEKNNISQQFCNNGNRLKGIPEIINERGMLSIAGYSRTVGAPMKIVWINQTRVLRFFTLINDELLIKKYAETVVRRTFGTENAMKLGKPITTDK